MYAVLYGIWLGMFHLNSETLTGSDDSSLNVAHQHENKNFFKK